MTTLNKNTFGADLRTLQAGIKANLSDVQSFIVGGVTYSFAQLTSKIDDFITAQTNALNSKNAYHAAVVSEQTSNAEAHVFRTQMQAYAVARYGKTNPILSQFSFAPSKAKAPTAAVKAVAVLKVKATRKARNTMGKNQKAKIKGTVDPSIAEMLTSEPSGTSEPVAAPEPGIVTPVALSAPAVHAPGTAEPHGA